GGANGGGRIAGVEIFDPVAETFTITGGMASPHAVMLAVLRTDGKVIVVGGSQNPLSNLPNPIEIFDPVTQTWSLGANIPNTVFDGTSVRLSDGRIFASG